MKRSYNPYSRPIISFLILLTSCLDSYNPEATKEDLKYLVVDGMLNISDSTCIVKLTRTNPIYGSNQVPRESRAKIILEEDNGDEHQLTEVSPGHYLADKLRIDNHNRYRLKISTNDDNAYMSDFIVVEQTPSIDTITWGYERNGIAFYISTHDDQNNSRYYRWKYSETWIYLSAYYSSLINVNGVIVDRPTSEQIYTCWKSESSTDILIATSDKLKSDVISNFTVNFIPWESPKLDRRYSMEVEQYAISKDAYDYWQQLKKNSESIGTLFALQPSRISGNILCTTNPNEIALGYFSAGSVQRKRIFVNGRDLNKPNGVTGYESCEIDFVKVGDGFGSSIPINEVAPGGVLIGYNVSTSQCVDCRLSGGTTVPPVFWK